MVRSAAEFNLAKRLHDAGLNNSQISRQLGISRAALRDWWTRSELPGSRGRTGTGCPICEPETDDRARSAWAGAYVYLLGMYLGDGWISHGPKDVCKLRVALDDDYPVVIEDCRRAMAVVSQRIVGKQAKIGCTEIHAHWKHWTCVIPQHGPGPKHLRRIRLEPWQSELISGREHYLLRGLLHSDGCRIERTSTRSRRTSGFVSLKAGPSRPRALAL